MRLEGKVAIVTGAASGMGKAIAEGYAKEGAKVAVSDLNLEGAQAVVEGIQAAGGTAFAIQTNVASTEDLQRLFDETKTNYGQLDILVNNAGIMDGMEPVGEISDERWEKVFAVNTTAVMRSMRMATEIFLAQGHGVFVNNISAGGFLVESVPDAKLGVLDAVEKYYSAMLPFYDIGLGWILPALIGAVIGSMIPSRKVI